MPSTTSPGCSMAKIDRRVGLRAAVRLNVGVFGVKELFCTVAGNVFGYVHILAARRNNDVPDNPRRIYWSAGEPMASSTAEETKFSEAMSSIWAR